MGYAMELGLHNGLSTSLIEGQVAGLKVRFDYGPYDGLNPAIDLGPVNVDHIMCLGLGRIMVMKLGHFGPGLVHDMGR